MKFRKDKYSLRSLDATSAGFRDISGPRPARHIGLSPNFNEGSGLAATELYNRTSM